MSCILLEYDARGLVQGDYEQIAPLRALKKGSYL